MPMLEKPDHDASRKSQKDGRVSFSDAVTGTPFVKYSDEKAFWKLPMPTRKNSHESAAHHGMKAAQT